MQLFRITYNDRASYEEGTKGAALDVADRMLSVYFRVRTPAAVVRGQHCDR